MSDTEILYHYLTDDEARAVDPDAFDAAQEALRRCAFDRGVRDVMSIHWFDELTEAAFRTKVARIGKDALQERAFKSRACWGFFLPDRPAEIAVKVGLGLDETLKVVAHEVEHARQCQRHGAAIVKNQHLEESDAAAFARRAPRLLFGIARKYRRTN